MSTSNTPAPSAAPAAPAETAAPESQETLETTAEEGQETAEASGEPIAEKAPSTPSVKKALKELRLKIDGKEVLEKLPFEIPDDPEAIEYMTRQLQMGKMGHGRAQKLAELEKQVGDFVTRLKKNPREALSDPLIGVDVKELARQVIEEEIENSKKSPEQLEKEKLQAELKELKEQQKREKEEWQAKEMERLQNEWSERYDQQFTKALEKSSLPKSPYVVKKMAEYMYANLQKGNQLSAEDVLPLVEAEIKEDIKAMFSAMPEDIVEQMVGKDKISALRKKAVAKAKPVPPTPVKAAIKDAGAKKTEEKGAKPQTYRDFFKV